MTGTPATAALARAGVAFVEHAYPHDARAESYGLEAASALGIDPARVFKTLVAEVDGEVVVAIVPVDVRLDTRALAAAAGGKRAGMADARVAERRTGYVLGGISPFGQRSAHRTFLDRSAERFDRILVSGGRRGLDLELAPADLVRVTGATFADLGR